MEVGFCPICLETIFSSEKHFVPDCNHPLHLECCEGLYFDICPMCRKPMKLPDELIQQITERQKRQKLEEELDQRATLATQEILERRLVLPPYIQYLAAKATLLKLFGVEAPKWEDLVEKYRDVVPDLTNIANDIILETMKSLSRTDELLSYIEKFSE